MTTDSDDTVRLRESSPTYPTHARRRNWCLPITVVVVVLLIILVIVLFPRSPTTKLISAKVTGFSPSLSFPINLQLNVTVDLEILIHNPNAATFSHDHTEAQLFYGGKQVGVAEVDPGRIAMWGSEHLNLTLKVDQLGTGLGSLFTDVMSGQIAFDAKTKIPGRVTILGVIKHKVVVGAECHVVVGLPGMNVKEQKCKEDTKL